MAPNGPPPLSLATETPGDEVASVHELDTRAKSNPPKTANPFLVAFEEPLDPENPKDWSRGKKWTVTDVMSATGFNRIMVSTIMAPALSQIAHDLHMDATEAVMAMSIYLLATAFGPLVIGPLSEVYGRRPILHASNVWFLVWNAVCGFARTKEVLIAARFLAGFGASAIYALAGGVLGDVWRPEERGTSLGVYLLIPILGAAIGPILGGFMAGRTTWRWIFWATSLFQAAMVVASFAAFHESYAPIILRRRAAQRRHETGDPRYYTVAERADGQRSVARVVQRSLTRPLRLLIFHPIIQIVAVLSGVGYGILYIVLSTFSNLWTSHYHESVEISGLHYLSIALGEIVGTMIGGPLMDKIFARLKHRARGETKPEFHVAIMLPAAVIGPIGLLAYGWCAEHRVVWPAVDVGIFVAMFGTQIFGLGLQAYLIDSYSEHTSSAVAAGQFMRSLAAFAFPLFAPKLYSSLGYGWGNSIIAFLYFALAVPAPVFLWLYGAKLRAMGHQSSY